MTDLDTLLRETLSSRADTITAGPTWHGPPSRRQQRWIAPLLAAVVVAVLALAVVFVVRRDDRDSPAADIAQVCETNGVPKAIADALTTTGGLDSTYRALTDDGELVTVANSRSVQVQAPGAAPRIAYRAPDRAAVEIGGVTVTGRFAVVAVDRARTSGYPPTVRIELVDLTNSRSTTLATARSNRTIENPVAFDGRAYWVERRPGPQSRIATIRSYDLASHHTHIVYSGRMIEANDLTLLPAAAGLILLPEHRVLVPARLPQAVLEHTDPLTRRQRLVTDGDSYLWTDPRRTRLFWLPAGSDRPLIRTLSRHLSGIARGETPAGSTHIAVAGHWAWIGNVLIDLTTASAVVIANSGKRPSLQLPDLQDGRHGAFGGSVPYDGLDLVLTVSPARIDTSALPELHC